ncbi:hypothetical protein SEUCBS139899_005532 [Sporothrix eucalyptigena]
MASKMIELDSASLGSHLTGIESNGIAHFRGIPYASIARRWTHSRVLDTIDTPTFDATAFGPRSPVPPRTSVIWSDDPPNGTVLPPADELRSRQDHDRLCRRAEQAGHPVILVSINYRLGPLGYAASSDLASEASPASSWPGLAASGDDYSAIVGSFGQVDQHNAFRWVQAHIRDFGGNPDRVTAAGVSAGAASIHYHILSGNPLFDRAILMSGAAGVLGPLPSSEYERAWKALLLATGVSQDTSNPGPAPPTIPSTSDTPARRLKALRALPADKIVALYPRQIAMGPSADGCLLPKKWSHQKISDVVSTRCRAIIVGDSQDESIIMVPLIQATVPADFYSRARAFFSPPEVAEGFLEAFGFHPGQLAADFHDAYRVFLSAVMFQHPALGLAASFNGDSFYYHVDEPSPYPGLTSGRAAHALCSMLLFQNDIDTYPRATRALAEKMAGTWTAFAHGIAPWELFKASRRFWLFGPAGICALTDFTSDKQRPYGYQGWLEENYDQTVAFCRGIFSEDWGR